MLVLPANRAEASDGLTPGDAAILRFLEAAEIIETDAWQQYNELGGVQDSEVPGGGGNAAYTAALHVLDSDMAQYIHDDTEDEFTHFSSAGSGAWTREIQHAAVRPLVDCVRRSRPVEAGRFVESPLGRLRMPRRHETPWAGAGATAFWTAAVFCRFSQGTPESASGLAHSKTWRSSRRFMETR